jgi:sugar phosphate isomerase/epimerase
MKLLISLCLAAWLPATAAEPRPLFVFDNGLDAIPTLAGKAELLVKLGYQGIGWRPANTAEMLAQLDKHGLEMHSTYVVLKATGNDCPIPDPIVAEIDVLKGRKTIVSLAIQGKSTDEIVLPALRRIAGLAARNGLNVALYPHVGMFTDTDANCLRLARLVDRPNVGVGFNLCHFLKQNDESAIEETLRAAAPYLRMVSICGADSGDTRHMKWDRLIQPLGRGSFDTRRPIKLLDKIGYHGPVGLQCYQINAPPAEYLAQSMAAWRALTRDEP